MTKNALSNRIVSVTLNLKFDFLMISVKLEPVLWARPQPPRGVPKLRMGATSVAASNLEAADGWPRRSSAGFVRLIYYMNLQIISEISCLLQFQLEQQQSLGQAAWHLIKPPRVSAPTISRRLRKCANSQVSAKIVQNP